MSEHCCMYKDGMCELDVDEAYQQGRTDAIDELETKLVDIILGNEEFINWEKQEICLCLECVIEQLKEQKNDD